MAGAEVGRELVDAGPEDVALATLPLFHVFGMNSIMNCTVHSRGLMTLVPRFDPEKVLEVIERDQRHHLRWRADDVRRAASPSRSRAL